MGGIFGLCLGGSVISLAELIYYFTMRLFYIWRSRRSDLQTTNCEKGYLQDCNRKISRININQETRGDDEKAYVVNLQKILCLRKCQSPKAMVKVIPNNVFLNGAVLKDLKIYSPRK